MTHAPQPSTTNPPPRALVTGGAGFLGSHLCDRLIAEGFEVICLDNLLTGTTDNIRHLLGHPRFTFVHHDVTHPIDLDALLSGKQGPQSGISHPPLNYILHFASPASPRDYARHPIHTLKVGALGTYHALGLAKAQGAVFLLASSSEVYGDPEVNPQPESYWGHVNPVGPRSVYDEAKRYAEAITMAYHRAHGLDVRIARIFNTYGPRMRTDDGRALPTFMTQALNGQPLTVYGDGSQTRSFCYVDDMVEGLFRLLLWRPSPLPPGASDATPVFNLGNPDEVTILQLAREVIQVTGSRSEIHFRPLPEDDPKVRRPDIGRATALLGWTPRVSRQEGLKRTVPYFREVLNQPRAVL
ncbi:MAG: SDR family oxidoreductase [Armatimonadota bacterium]|nr:SDR family oxidoreductase [Armatimonadota bacterium]MDR7404947.1 SDR family oxidoreductase [Armatimonadota bacterium]